MLRRTPRSSASLALPSDFSRLVAVFSSALLSGQSSLCRPSALPEYAPAVHDRTCSRARTYSGSSAAAMTWDGNGSRNGPSYFHHSRPDFLPQSSHHLPAPRPLSPEADLEPLSVHAPQLPELVAALEAGDRDAAWEAFSDGKLQGTCHGGEGGRAVDVLPQRVFDHLFAIQANACAPLERNSTEKDVELATISWERLLELTGIVEAIKARRQATLPESADEARESLTTLDSEQVRPWQRLSQSQLQRLFQVGLEQVMRLQPRFGGRIPSAVLRRFDPVNPAALLARLRFIYELLLRPPSQSTSRSTLSLPPIGLCERYLLFMSTISPLKAFHQFLRLDDALRIDSRAGPFHRHTGERLLLSLASGAFTRSSAYRVKTHEAIEVLLLRLLAPQPGTILKPPRKRVVHIALTSLPSERLDALLERLRVQVSQGEVSEAVYSAIYERIALVQATERRPEEALTKIIQLRTGKTVARPDTSTEQDVPTAGVGRAPDGDVYAATLSGLIRRMSVPSSLTAASNSKLRRRGQAERTQGTILTDAECLRLALRTYFDMVRADVEPDSYVHGWLVQGLEQAEEWRRIEEPKRSVEGQRSDESTVESSSSFWPSTAVHVPLSALRLVTNTMLALDPSLERTTLATHHALLRLHLKRRDFHFSKRLYVLLRSRIWRTIGTSTSNRQLRHVRWPSNPRHTDMQLFRWFLYAAVKEANQPFFALRLYTDLIADGGLLRPKNVYNFLLTGVAERGSANQIKQILADWRAEGLRLSPALATTVVRSFAIAKRPTDVLKVTWELIRQYGQQGEPPPIAIFDVAMDSVSRATKDQGGGKDLRDQLLRMFEHQRITSSSVEPASKEAALLEKELVEAIRQVSRTAALGRRLDGEDASPSSADEKLSAVDSRLGQGDSLSRISRAYVSPPPSTIAFNAVLRALSRGSRGNEVSRADVSLAQRLVAYMRHRQVPLDKNTHALRIRIWLGLERSSNDAEKDSGQKGKALDKALSVFYEASSPPHGPPHRLRSNVVGALIVRLADAGRFDDVDSVHSTWRTAWRSVVQQRTVDGDSVRGREAEHRPILDDREIMWDRAVVGAIGYADALRCADPSAVIAYLSKRMHVSDEWKERIRNAGRNDAAQQLRDLAEEDEGGSLAAEADWDKMTVMAE